MKEGFFMEGDYWTMRVRFAPFLSPFLSPEKLQELAEKLAEIVKDFLKEQNDD